MIFRGFPIILFLLCAGATHADKVQSVIDQAMTGLTVKISSDPYSRTIERMLIGYDADGQPKVGIAYREIESFKPITGIVIVYKTADGYILHEAVFPDIKKIRKAKDRKQVLSILKQFKGITFNPHVEKSAVDGLTGAPRYGIKTSGYLNHMARRIAIEMEASLNGPN